MATVQCYQSEAVMDFRSHSSGTMELAHPPQGVAALTTAEGLAAWFGEEAASTCARAEQPG